MVFQKQSIIIASSSVFVLLLTSILGIYLYRSQVLPEVAFPDHYAKSVTAKLNHLNLEISNVRKKYKKLLYVPAPNLDSYTSGVETVMGTAAAVAFGSEVLDKPKPEESSPVNSTEGKVEEIENFSLPSESGAPQDVQHELKATEADSDDLPTTSPNSVTYGLLGLKLETPVINAAIYKIKNIFGEPGRIGHYFIVDTGKTGKLQPEHVNFSSLDTFKSSANADYEVTEGPWTLVMSSKAPPDNWSMEKIKQNVVPMGASRKLQLNPFKWLYLATSLAKNANFKPFSVLLIASTSESSESITYPVDISVQSERILKGMTDKTVYTADLKRILNHCHESIDSSIIF